jgi:hypothetical protein
MITVAIFNISVVFLAYLARHKPTEFWLKLSFVLLFFFLALRYDYGNDYDGYLQGFLDAPQLDTFETTDYFGGHSHYEPGWIFLCLLFKPLGFFAMTAVLALFNCIVYYRFIKKYVPPAYYWLAVFLYVYNPGFMLIHSSAMRQSIAISLFLLSIDYLYKKDALRYFLCVSIAASFHASALILLPVYLLGLFNWKINTLTAVSLFSLFLLMFVFAKFFLPFLEEFVNSVFPRYGHYNEPGEIATGLGVVFYSALFALVLFYARSQTAEVSLLFKLAVVSYLFMPLCLLIIMVGRVGMYFEPVTVAVLPIMLLNIKERLFRNGLLVMLVSITLYSFYGFFHSDVWSEAFGQYKTIFSSPEIY